MATKNVSDASEFKRWKHEEQQKMDFEAYLKRRLKMSRTRRKVR